MFEVLVDSILRTIIMFLQAGFNSIEKNEDEDN